jgi:hypothetical protein
MSKNTDLGSLINYIKGQVTGRLNAPAYTSATAFTGTIAGYLGFDTSGNILTSAGVGFTGSGTTNFISKFTGSTALGNSLIFDNGTNIGINTILPNIIGASGTIMTINHTSGVFSGLELSSLGVSKGVLLNDNGNSIILASITAIPLIFQTSAVEKFRLQASGNVSIGNTNNTYKLDVTGDVNISGTYRVNGTAIGGVTGSGSTNLMPLWTSTTGLGNSIIYNSGGNLGINSTTNGYTLNAIRSASTTFSDTFKGTGGNIEIMTRFMQDESTKKGIAIGYNATFSYSAIFGTQDGANLRIGVLSGSLYKAMIVLSTNTVSMDLPTSGGGLTSGMLYNDGGTVKIIT